MKIAQVEVFRLAAQLSRPFHWSTGTARQRTALLVRIMTDSGLAGWGEALQPQAGPIVQNMLAPQLLGQDPMERLPLRQRMAACFPAGGGFCGLALEAIGAVDIALWDLAGKALGQPLHRLLGGAVRNRIKVYASGLYYGDRDADLASEALGYAKQDFCGVKMKIGWLPVPEDLVRVRAVCRALGETVPLMVDANQFYNRAAAIDMGRRLEDLGVFWLEEPLPMEEVEGYAHLANRLSLRIAAGENLHGPQRFYPFLSGHWISIAQPNLARIGGITEFPAIAVLAKTFGVPLALHGWGSPVLISAALHVLACLPADSGVSESHPCVQEPVLELDCTPNPLREVLPSEVLAPRNGALPIPDGPGLGVDPEESRFAPYRVRLDEP